MKTIARNPNPPGCLSHQPAHQDWQLFIRTQCYSAVSESLHREQQYLCSYCELQIADGNSHVEHMEPRSLNPGRTYEYDNLTASCNGGSAEHCGHFKDNRGRNPNCGYDTTKFCSPHNPATSRLFLYLANGEVGVVPGLLQIDTEKANYMIGNLGLNCPRLKGRRRAHARDLINTLGPDPRDDLWQWMEQYYLQPDGDNLLKQFYSLSKAILKP